LRIVAIHTFGKLITNRAVVCFQFPLIHQMFEDAGVDYDFYWYKRYPNLMSQWMHYEEYFPKTTSKVLKDYVHEEFGWNDRKKDDNEKLMRGKVKDAREKEMHDLYEEVEEGNGRKFTYRKKIE